MALCENCPAMKIGFAGIELYDFGNGCPDEDYDCYGGDCIALVRESEETEPYYHEELDDYF